jgi:hypothetical protein
MQHARAYDNPQEKERALSDEASPYYKIAKHSLEQLFNKEIVTRETRSDPTDDKKYITYCKTSLLNALCKEISRYDLPDIETIYGGYCNNTLSSSKPRFPCYVRWYRKFFPKWWCYSVIFMGSHNWD